MDIINCSNNLQCTEQIRRHLNYDVLSMISSSSTDDYVEIIDIKDPTGRLDFFIENLKTHFPECNYSNFRNNIANLKIVVGKKMSLMDRYYLWKNYASGLCFDNKNKILVKDESLLEKGVLVHELLHLASKKNSKNGNLAGFQQVIKDKKTVVGTAINEGCTEYFSFLITGESNAYFNEVKIARLLELVVGQKKLTEFYFNADLKSLTDELIKYSDYETVNAFINYCDTIRLCAGEYIDLSEMNSHSSNDITDYEYAKNVYHEITRLLFLMLQNKLSKVDISNDEKIVLYDYFIKVCDIKKNFDNSRLECFEFLSMGLRNIIENEINSLKGFTR